MIESMLIVEGFKEAISLAQKLSQAVMCLSMALPQQRKYHEAPAWDGLRIKGCGYTEILCN